MCCTHLRFIESRLMVVRSKSAALEVAVASVVERVRARIDGAPITDRTSLPAIDVLCERFHLSSIERDVIELAVVAEVDPETARRIRSLRGGVSSRPTVGLVLQLFAADLPRQRIEILGAFARGNQLERMALVELAPSGSLLDCEISLPAALWPRLIGLSVPNRFAPRSGPVLGALALSANTRARVDLVLEAMREQNAPALVVGGPRGTGRRLIAEAVFRELGYGCIAIAAADATPSNVAEVIREAALSASAIVIEGDVATEVLDRVLVDHALPIAIIGGTQQQTDSLSLRRPVHEVVVDALDPATRRALWAKQLPADQCVDGLTPALLAERYRFDAARTVWVARRARRAAIDRLVEWEDIQAASREEVQSVAHLVERLECPYEPEDLVVPGKVVRELDLVRTWWRTAATAFGPGGAGERVRARRGLGCLFAGASGTGKTMAAQILARQLGCELWRIDLSRVVDKYIGETEKNIDRLFAAAEQHGAMLFFDEADALFAKRTSVNTSNDRFANLEVAFLLQRMERHPGIVILATNLAGNIDDAFSRRTQVMIDFPLPDGEQRVEIWKRHLVAERLATDVDLDYVAKSFALSGGQIRNAVIAAVLLGSQTGDTIAMRHLVIAVWRELSKTGRMIDPADFGRWQRDITAYSSAGAS